MQINAPAGAEQRMSSSLADQLQRRRKQKKEQENSRQGDRVDLSDAARLLADAIDSVAPLMSHIRAWYLPEAVQFNSQLANTACNNIIAHAGSNGIRLNRELIMEELLKQYPLQSAFAPYFPEELAERLPFYQHILSDEQFLPERFITQQEKLMLEHLQHNMQESENLAQINHLALICCLAKWSVLKQNKKAPQLGVHLIGKLQEGLQKDRFRQLFSASFLQQATDALLQHSNAAEQQKTRLSENNSSP